MSGKLFTLSDAAVIAVLLLLCWVLWDGVRRNAPVRQVEIVSAGGTLRFPLGEPRALPVEGPLGESVIRFDADSVAFASSPCPNKLCVRSGSLRHGGQFAACLPNRVAVRLVPGVSRDGGGEGVDAVGR